MVTVHSDRRKVGVHYLVRHSSLPGRGSTRTPAKPRDSIGTSSVVDKNMKPYFQAVKKGNIFYKGQTLIVG